MRNIYNRHPLRQNLFGRGSLQELNEADAQELVKQLKAEKWEILRQFDRLLTYIEVCQELGWPVKRTDSEVVQAKEFFKKYRAKRA